MEPATYFQMIQKVRERKNQIGKMLTSESRQRIHIDTLHNYFLFFPLCRFEIKNWRKMM